MNPNDFRPTRVLVSADGKAVNPDRAEREFGVFWELAFIRDDGWSLACPAKWEKQARQTWDGNWVKVVNRITGTLTYLDRPVPTVVG